MRLIFTSLVLAAGLTTVAQAQDTAAQPAPAPPPVQSATPAPAAPATPSQSATPAPAAPATPGQSTTPAPAAPAAPGQAAPPAPQPTVPADQAAPGATAAAPAAEPAGPPPSLPTSGTGAEAISILEKICVPAVRGQEIDDLAKANGFKKNRRDLTWSRRLGDGKDKYYEAIVYPQGSNKTVCIVDFHYPLGQDEEVTKALNVWAFVHQPPLEPTANYTQPVDPDGLHRVRRSWEYLTQNQSIGLNYSVVRNPDNTQVDKHFDLGTLQYQERTF